MDTIDIGRRSSKEVPGGFFQRDQINPRENFPHAVTAKRRIHSDHSIRFCWGQSAAIDGSKQRKMDQLPQFYGLGKTKL